MESCLKLEFVLGEPSKIRVHATNGFYSGFTEEYINSNLLSQLAENLTGFPERLDSVVEFESKRGKGEASSLYFKFYCVDSLGHMALRACMKKGIYAGDIPDEAKLEIRYEASALDIFSASLKSIIENGEGNATLEGIRNDT